MCFISSSIPLYLFLFCFHFHFLFVFFCFFNLAKRMGKKNWDLNYSLVNWIDNNDTHRHAIYNAFICLFILYLYRVFYQWINLLIIESFKCCISYFYNITNIKKNTAQFLILFIFLLTNIYYCKSLTYLFIFFFFWYNIIYNIWRLCSF